MDFAKAIDFAVKAGFGNYAYEAAGIFHELVNEVEKATLEKAAAHLKELASANEVAAQETCDSDNETWHEHAALVYMRSAESVMNLGDAL